MAASKYAYKHYYSKAYTGPESVNGDHGLALDVVPRHNHGLANSIRKACLVPVVTDVFRKTHPAVFTELTKRDVELMQLGQLFRSSGRQSEVSGWEDYDRYCAYNKAGIRHLIDYCSAVAIEGCVKECAESLGYMFSTHKPAGKVGAMANIAEVCHLCDLLRIGVDSRDQVKCATFGRSQCRRCSSQ